MDDRYWRLLRVLAGSRLEDITADDSRTWDVLARVLDEGAAVTPDDLRPDTVTLAADLRTLTDRASARVHTMLTVDSRERAGRLLREVHDRLGEGTEDIGLLRRVAWMAVTVLEEVMEPTSAAASSAARALPEAFPASRSGSWPGGICPARCLVVRA
ncbi:hypothetical protein ACFV2Q_20210 [Streptomyces sp. NPDC059650]|uniref:hypothetical protein n=1 Tax=Streptomyces sp. NPDC059650 TaxID=3346896 RepID=UPI00369CF92E